MKSTGNSVKSEKNHKSVRCAEGKDLAAIEDFIDRYEGISLYHHFRWCSLIRNRFSHETHYLICAEEGPKILGVLPLVHMNSVLFGNLMVSMPYFNYGGVCAADKDTRDLLIGEAVRLARGKGVGHIELRQEMQLDNGFPEKTRKASMRLPLPGSADDLWKSLPSKLRSQVRKPMKEGLTARIGKHDEVGNFYKIFSINMRDLGTPVYPKNFFIDILDNFHANSWICTVSKGGVPMASGFLLGFKDKLEIPWASSIRKYNFLAPNMLLYWSCLKFACEQGYRVFDFGRSTVGESTYRFKEQWGAVHHPMFWHYWMEKEDELPEINPSNPKYKFAIDVWKRLPVILTNLLGPRLVRNIP
jgi:FemAB-related protein (PEP-CTERM system-associated)